MKFLLLISLTLLLVSCNPSVTTSKAKTNGKSAVTGQMISTDRVAQAQFKYELRPSELAAQSALPNADGVWSGVNIPSWLTLDSMTGILYGVAPDSGQFADLKLLHTSGNNVTQIGPFSIRIKSDPLFSDQWSLNNLGQTAYSQSGGNANEDINFLSALHEGYSGKDISIAISDVAVQIEHEDLFANVDATKNRDYVTSPSSSGWAGTPLVSDSSYSFHGTAVAGLIAAVGWNGLGLRGVAPRAKISTLNFIDSNQSLSKTIDQITGAFDIVNQSWGVSPNFPESIEPEYLTALKNSTSTQRKGLGTLIVKAAGNGFNSLENANQDYYNNNFYSVIVGSLNALGEKASYSSLGSSLWISAPGGEYGKESPAMITTDLMGCEKGSSTSASLKNNFENGSETINFQCNYTSAFNGTSAATPIVSGAIALILEANPNLSWRDVKHVLAKTARKVAPDSQALSKTSDASTVEFDLGWITNSAGYHFHNFFGFGALDVSSAISFAKTMVPLPAAQEFLLGTISGLDSKLGTSANPILEFQIPVSINKTIESVQVEVEISHSFFGDIAIELVSPSGTRSIAMTPLNSFIGSVDENNNPISEVHTFDLVSNAFYEEGSNGTWKVIVKDQIVGDNGSVKSVKLRALAR